MIFDQKFPSKAYDLVRIRGMVMDSSSMSCYLLKRFPYEINDLAIIKTLYPSLILSIDHYQMVVRSDERKTVVENALIAYWPSNMRSQFAVVEFTTIQFKFRPEPDISLPKRILLSLLRDQWNIRFHGKELVVS